MRLRYFAWLRERVGRGEEEIALPDGVGTLGELVEWLRRRDDRFAEAFAVPEIIRGAVNQEFAQIDARVSDADEVAFFPPVTGG